MTAITSMDSTDEINHLGSFRDPNSISLSSSLLDRLAQTKVECKSRVHLEIDGTIDRVFDFFLTEFCTAFQEQQQQEQHQQRSSGDSSGTNEKSSQSAFSPSSNSRLILPPDCRSNELNDLDDTRDNQFGDDSEFDADDPDCDCSECCPAIKQEILNEDDDDYNPDEDKEKIFCRNGKRPRISCLPNDAPFSPNIASTSNDNSNSTEAVTAHEQHSSDSGSSFQQQHRAQLPRTRNVRNVKTLRLNCGSGCEMTFEDKFQLNDHLMRVHRVYPCRCLHNGCNRTFRTSEELSHHFNSCHASVLVSGQWKCGQCVQSSRTYQSHFLLHLHSTNYHQKGQFQCAQADCPFPVSSRRIDIIQHYHRSHRLPSVDQLDLSHQPSMVNKSLLCRFPGCSRSFIHQTHLRMHENTHRGVRPYRCRWEGCLYGATQRNNVISHIRMVHFNLPHTVKEQKELNIQDDRNPKDYLEVVQELLH